MFFFNGDINVHYEITKTKNQKVRNQNLPNTTSTDVFSESHSCGKIFSDDTSSETIVRVIGAVHNFFKCFELQDALDWTEDLINIKKITILCFL